MKKLNTTHQKQIAKFEVNTKQLSYNENLSRKTAEQLLIETKELRTLLSSMKSKLNSINSTHLSEIKILQQEHDGELATIKELYSQKIDSIKKDKIKEIDSITQLHRAEKEKTAKDFTLKLKDASENILIFKINTFQN